MADEPTAKSIKEIKYGDVIAGWRFRDRRYQGDKPILVFAKVLGERKYDRAIPENEGMTFDDASTKLQEIEAEITAPKEPVQG